MGAEDFGPQGLPHKLQLHVAAQQGHAPGALARKDCQETRGRAEERQDSLVMPVLPGYALGKGSTSSPVTQRQGLTEGPYSPHFVLLFPGGTHTSICNQSQSKRLSAKESPVKVSK